MPVRLALVVQARDRLLADVAALGEADRALVDPRLLRASSRVVISGPNRGRPDSTRSDLRGAPRPTSAPPRRRSCSRTRVGGRGGNDQVDAEVGGDGAASGAADRDLAVRVLGTRGRRRRRVWRGGADQRERSTRPRGRPRPRRRGRPCTCRGGGARRSAASGSVSIQNSSVGEPQDPHVGPDLALAVEQRGVAALAGLERLDVVGQLALEVLGRLGAGDRQLAAVGAIERGRPPRAGARYWPSSSSVAEAHGASLRAGRMI